ncbi:SPOC like C-terminal domain-containing protein [Xylogone sp. PMI_703]|nr:SPOC like C-terminal domain-containing protein [Xylogone sp. PMI_703]
MADEEKKWRPDDEDQEDEDDIDENDYRDQKDAVLFAIDISKSMLAPPPPSDSKNDAQDSPALAALKCAYMIMQQRIISNPKDMIGVLLFGTEKSKFQEDHADSQSGLAYPHCYLFTDLDVPAAGDVKELRELVEDEEVRNEILQPAKEQVSMSNVLFCANQIFTTKAPNFGSRRLFVITDEDNPHAADKNARAAAAVRAKDLYDLGVVIELFPISRVNHQFDKAKFYDDIIYRDPAEVEELSPGLTELKAEGGDGISLLTGLISDINSKQVAKRALFSNLPFEIGPGFRISVKGFNILQRQEPARSSYIWLEGETAQVVTGETTKLEEESGRTLDKTEIKKAYKFGGGHVFFTPAELKELKNFGQPILRIIGFKPRSMLPLWASIKKSTFIYPSEEDYVGSTRVFSALWQKLLKDKKMGIAWYIARSNATPIIVAILPSAERTDSTSKGQVIPAGLWLYPLPFVDDIRNPPGTPDPLVSPDELIDKMRIIVQQLQLPKAMYDPAKYPNPALQWHYRILQAIALEEEIPETPDDKTVPRYRQIDKRAGEYAIQWGETLEALSLVHSKHRGTAAGVKRDRGATDDDDRGKKKSKVASSAPKSLEEMSMDDLRKIIQGDRLDKYKVADLKDLLRSKGLSDSGKKSQLVERIEQWVEDN